jgi:quinol monooxygenase YgiN
MSPRVTIARLTTLPGAEQAGLALLQRAQGPTHAEPGCRLYALHVDSADPRRIVVVEIWDDQEAFDAHIASPHVQELIAASDGVFAAPPAIEHLDAVPGGHPVKGAVTGD